ncbi:FAD/NAD(P)-binding domain-containing protein [Phialemonium atrogriseum]|uniref:FAD/NAD(P)-binding domain-containing protein n=1 Tax=Phialemonium atrogriseum TaxID=1093897 RepID=A0AAJ0BT85_9PEZI|nr:FAD/NAD(P)-binding domain-containing protein [Phialemonium atrogriseum]KAK1762978.1 FAD/NAD(P)-binding domain-containing protein [Phialemonium atrogriseum]
MFLDVLRLITTSLPFFSVALRLLVQKLQALVHRHTYKAVSQPRDVVVVGGSFAGLQLVRRLSETLPRGYRAVLVEPNSHINFVFNFPRYSVATGHEAKAFIPHDGLARSAPDGVYLRIRDAADGISVPASDAGGNKNNPLLLHLTSGRTLPYAYLVLATGAAQPFPARVRSTDKQGACAELRAMQARVAAAPSVAVVGAGAVGVEIATDVKAFYPAKRVVLVHSRDRLLPRFGPRLHAHVLAALGRMGVEVVLGERPVVVGDGGDGPARLRFEDGREEEFGLVIPCTGQRPNSDIISEFSPDAISKETRCILVKPTLQVAASRAEHGNIFALGDVAETGGPKMARAGFMQAEVVCSNILSMINGEEPAETYRPIAMEGAIKLTLGKTDWVVYLQKDDGTEILVSGKGGKEDLGIRGFWRQFGVEFKDGSD